MNKLTKTLVASSLVLLVGSSVTATVVTYLNVHKNKNSKTWENVAQLQDDIVYQYDDNVKQKKVSIEDIDEDQETTKKDFKNSVGEIVTSGDDATATYGDLIAYASKNSMYVVDWTTVQQTIDNTQNNLTLQINSMSDISYEEKQEQIATVKGKIKTLVTNAKNRNYNVQQTCDYFYDNSAIIVPTFSDEQKKLQTGYALNKIVKNSQRQNNVETKTNKTKDGENEVLYLDELEKKEDFKVGNNIAKYLPTTSFSKKNTSCLLTNDMESSYTLKAKLKSHKDDGSERKIKVLYGLVQNEYVDTNKEEEQTVYLDEETEFDVDISPEEENIRCENWFASHKLEFDPKVAYYDHLISNVDTNKKLSMERLSEWVKVDDKELTLENTENYNVECIIRDFDNKENRMFYAMYISPAAVEYETCYVSSMQNTVLPISPELKNKVVSNYDKIYSSVARFESCKNNVYGAYSIAANWIYQGSLIFSAIAIGLIFAAACSFRIAAAVSAGVASAALISLCIVAKIKAKEASKAQAQATLLTSDPTVNANIDNAYEVLKNCKETVFTIKKDPNAFISFEKIDDVDKQLSKGLEYESAINKYIAEKKIDTSTWAKINDAKLYIMTALFITGIVALVATYVMWGKVSASSTQTNTIATEASVNNLTNESAGAIDTVNNVSAVPVKAAGLGTKVLNALKFVGKWALGFLVIWGLSFLIDKISAKCS